MTVSASDDAFWSLIAELGAAIASPAGERPPYAALLSRLATLCGATVEVWRIDTTVTPGAGWRLLAHGAPGALVGPAPKAPTAIVGGVVAALRPVAISQPFQQLALPLLVRGRLLGVLCLRAVDGPLLSRQAALERFAPLLALALHADTPLNAADEAAMERFASLAIGVHLSEQLERELARARRTFRPCALLLTGVDRFEEFVATVGAATWEQIAQSLMITLRDVCRDGDMVGRHGAERHLIFLPEADGAGAALAARRYLSLLYRRPIIVPDHEPFYLDASIGIALFPVDGSTMGELLASAGAALATARYLGGRRAVAA